MNSTYKEKSSKVIENLSRLSTESPSVMKNFQTLHLEATKEGVLSIKTKELLALAIAVAVRCEECVIFHMQQLIKLGVKKEELKEMLGIVILMGGGPSVMASAKALEIFDELSR